MAQYEVRIAMTLYLVGKLTVQARDKDDAHSNVQELIEAGTFLITDWKVETDPDHEFDEVQADDQRAEIDSIEEVR